MEDVKQVVEPYLSGPVLSIQKFDRFELILTRMISGTQMHDVPNHFILENLQFLLMAFWQTMKPRSAVII